MARLLFFGRLQDVTGAREISFDLPTCIATTDDLRAHLHTQFSEKRAFLDSVVRIAINDEFAVEPAQISNSDEIAFMPPVGGG